MQGLMVIPWRMPDGVAMCPLASRHLEALLRAAEMNECISVRDICAAIEEGARRGGILNHSILSNALGVAVVCRAARDAFPLSRARRLSPGQKRTGEPPMGWVSLCQASRETESPKR